MANIPNTKYIMIKNEIKKAIQSNELKANDKVLSETQICEKYNVSRITATRAVNELVSEGYLYRIQGKGTFVKGKQISEGVLHLLGFTQRMKKQNYKLETKLLERKSVPIPMQMADFFHLTYDTNVILLKRLRIVNAQPLCISISYLMPEIFYWTLLEDMEKESLYSLLENKYHFNLGKAVQEFQIGYLNKKDASFLNITGKDPCLKLSLYCYLADSQPAQYEETYYLGNQYSYQIILDSPKSGDSF